ncbi:peptidase [Rhodobacteraceae bacterium RKSG542]|uniref:dipeptidase n=1 Tax=Pseudovibrio flavus TaxID=2529854 RepID=UPI0012BC8040|nr:dipeptidase [Pseudovibrio flavus]MTI18882.1 peptidase [Pseudovibrio flavus]
MSARPTPIFDGHNDTLLKLELKHGTDRERDFFKAADYDHIDLPRARQGGLAGGFFALWVPSNIGVGTNFSDDDPRNFASVPQGPALEFTHKLINRAEAIAAASNGEVVICRTSEEISAGIEAGKFTMLLHIEGAEAIDAEFTALDALYERGLRSIGPVWSRKNIFADGVPMRFNSSPDTGDGLTEVGRELVRRCNAKGIMLDVSHITEKGFWDMAAINEKPIVATHSNAHAVCPHARNLTDKQLAAIAETKGVVGINYAVQFLRDDGRLDPNTPLEVVVRHADYLLSKLGEDGVALGSDFDGCTVPNGIKDAAGLPNLLNAFRAAGYGEALIEKIAYKNWLSLLKRTGI